MEPGSTNDTTKRIFCKCRAQEFGVRLVRQCRGGLDVVFHRRTMSIVKAHRLRKFCIINSAAVLPERLRLQGHPSRARSIEKHLYSYLRRNRLFQLYCEIYRPITLKASLFLIKLFGCIHSTKRLATCKTTGILLFR